MLGILLGTVVSVLRERQQSLRQETSPSEPHPNLLWVRVRVRVTRQQSLRQETSPEHPSPSPSPKPNPM